MTSTGVLVPVCLSSEFQGAALVAEVLQRVEADIVALAPPLGFALPTIADEAIRRRKLAAELRAWIDADDGRGGQVLAAQQVLEIALALEDAISTNEPNVDLASYNWMLTTGDQVGVAIHLGQKFAIYETIFGSGHEMDHRYRSDLSRDRNARQKGGAARAKAKMNRWGNRALDIAKQLDAETPGISAWEAAKGVRARWPAGVTGLPGTPGINENRRIYDLLAEEETLWRIGRNLLTPSS